VGTGLVCVNVKDLGATAREAYYLGRALAWILGR